MNESTKSLLFSKIFCQAAKNKYKPYFLINFLITFIALELFAFLLSFFFLKKSAKFALLFSFFLFLVGFVLLFSTFAFLGKPAILLLELSTALFFFGLGIVLLATLAHLFTTSLALLKSFVLF